MAKQRTRAWWERTVARWRRSGRTGSEFAERRQVGTLRWWSSRLGRDTRAQHGAVEIKPIEISVSGAGGRSVPATFEVMVGDAVLRCDVGTDVEYVATLVRTLRGS